MSSKRNRKPGGLTGKLLAVEPEYRFAVYKKLPIKSRAKKLGAVPLYSKDHLKAANAGEGKSAAPNARHDRALVLRV